VRALDERSLELRLTQPAAYLPTLAASVLFSPVKREAVEADPDGWWRNPAARVGNGPFRAVAIEPDLDIPRIRFAANERYWGGRPNLDGIDYLYYVDSDRTNDVVEAYRRGELDVAYPWEELMPAVEADPALSAELLWSPLAQIGHMPFNLRREPFQDKKVRQAFAYGFDREAWCREIEFGDCTPALAWIGPGSPGHIETDAFAYDPAKARQALAESSYGGPANLPEVVWYYFPEDSKDVRIAEWLAAQYRSVLGVELKLVPTNDEEFDALYESAATWPQLDWRWWEAQYPDPHGWLSVYWTCDSEIHAKPYGYCNPAFDALVARADAELDPAMRLALYEEAQRLLLADAPTIIINNGGLSMLIKPHVVGYVVTPADLGWPGWFTPLTIDIAPAA
jgi:oligopeptide transport system substrate-binding protein